MRIWILLLCFSTLCAHVKLDPKKLRQKLPQWMLEQIEEEFRTHTSVNRHQILHTVSTVHKLPDGGNTALVHMVIKNNKLTSPSRVAFEKDERFQQTVRFFEEALKHLNFPDIEFALSLWDCYDDPIFLHHTTCPVFTICKKQGNTQAIMWPEMRNLGWKTNLYRAIQRDDTAWEKKKAIAFWRGASSGGFYTDQYWDEYPRSRLVLFSKSHPNLVDAKFSHIYWSSKELINWLKAHNFIVKWSYPVTNLGYKYQIAVEGNSFPTSMPWQLLANIVVLKSRSSYIEWYNRGLREGEHYLLYDPDCHDLAGIIRHLRSHDKHAKQIAKASTDFARRYFTPEVMTLYVHHLLKRYAKIYTG